jgi:hypothetical protein
MARGRGYPFLGARLLTFWQQYQLPADERANENRGGRPAWAATTETLVRLIVTVLIIIFEISRITHPIRGGVLGTMPIEQCLLLWGMNPRGLRAGPVVCSAGQAWARPRPARPIGLWMKRELCRDVTFMPLPEGFVHSPFHAMVVMSGSVARMESAPEPDKGSLAFLHDVVSSPPGCSSRRYHGTE